VAGLALVAGCGRLPFQAQPAKVPRVGWLESGPPPGPGEASRVDDFRQGLRELGYREGQNVVVEPRYGEGSNELVEQRAAELVRLPVDVIVTAAGPASLLAARAATQTIPIVMVGNLPDPVGFGLVASYARPGGNVTGLTIFPQGGPTGKQLELLKEVTPGLAKVAMIVDASTGAGAPPFGQPAGSGAAQALRVETVRLEASDADSLDAALEAARREGAGALIVPGSPLMMAHSRRIAEFAVQHRMATMSGGRPLAQDGLLMIYGAADQADMHRRAAYYVDRILKGANPADLPVEQPMRFDFVVNLRTAQALGLTIPPHVLLQTTAVIQ
jgi:putative tryptophan/tyrosine transport system substrate-binding protein